MTLLPGVDGYRVCATLRAESDWTPIVLLTALDGELDETEGWTPAPTTT